MVPPRPQKSTLPKVLLESRGFPKTFPIVDNPSIDRSIEDVIPLRVEHGMSFAQQGVVLEPMTSVFREKIDPDLARALLHDLAKALQRRRGRVP